MTGKVKLGVNIDHVATLRNARGGRMPCPLDAAKAAAAGGADSITVHLREDRRHIRDHDVFALRELNLLPLHLEIAATQEMTRIALQVKPRSVCLVPEKRHELTTEGGLNALQQLFELKDVTGQLQEQGVDVSLFLDPAPIQIDAAAAIGADMVELHTGAYASAETPERREREAAALRFCAEKLASICIECHAGHGLNTENVFVAACLPGVTELNIGHAIVARSVFIGLEAAVREMRDAIDDAARAALTPARA